VIVMSEIKLETGIQHSDERQNILIGGDYFPRLNINKSIHFDDPLRAAISDASLAAANLEAPVQPQRSDPAPKYGPALSVAPNDLTALSSAGFDIINLANNHIMDYGKAGLDTTIQQSKKHNLRYTGAGNTRNEALGLCTTNHKGNQIGIINAADKEFGVAGDNRPGYAWISDPSLPERITRASQITDILLLILHGGIEYEPIPSIQRQNLYRRFADAGADVIIGHHPHVPQGWEVYNDTPICYSLGHLLFDFPPKYRKPKTEWGLIANIKFDDSGVTEVILHPIEQQQNTPRVQFLADTAARSEYLQQSCAVINDRNELISLWQALAVQRYDNYYRDRFDRSLITKLRIRNEEHLRWLQNVNQCEAHQWCIQTATCVLGGTCEDTRTKECYKNLEQLRENTRQSLLNRIKQRIQTML